MCCGNLAIEILSQTRYFIIFVIQNLHTKDDDIPKYDVTISPSPTSLDQSAHVLGINTKITRANTNTMLNDSRLCFF